MKETGPRSVVLALLAICVVALTLRTVWLRADPPVAGAVGIVWHDEGAWVHNARNRALWGTWRTDAWNPVFVAPVFTALEYASFDVFGVGTWQARVVPVASGLVAVLALAAGLFAVAGARTALVGALLLAINYPFVMWNRAALMESTLTALIVCAWAAFAAGERRSAWGAVAGLAAVLAWFTKASAAFFIAALAIASVWALLRPLTTEGAPDGANRRLGTMTLAGLAVSALLIGAVFVLPHWQEYAFYNWQMSVTRKPEYTVKAIIDRASWLPVVQGIFSRMPLPTAAGLFGLVGIVARWRTATAGERLLVLWLAIGLADPVVHDSGHERRYVMFLPALVALASLVLTRSMTAIGRRTSPVAPRTLGGDALMAIALLPSLYLLAGTLLRPAFLVDIEAGDLKTVVRLSAAIAVVAALALWRWRGILIALIEPRVPASWLAALLVLSVGWNGFEFLVWAGHRRYVNYEASVAVGQALPAGTLVQGKLANGLSLENRIRPIFVGNGFGNYEDRLRRDDVRYILTYDLPAIGFESSNGSGLIQGILDHYPDHRTVATFEVDETPSPDRAVLIDKRPASP